MTIQPVHQFGDDNIAKNNVDYVFSKRDKPIVKSFKNSNPGFYYFDEETQNFFEDKTF